MTSIFDFADAAALERDATLAVRAALAAIRAGDPGQILSFHTGMKHRDFFLPLAEEVAPKLWEATRWTWLQFLEFERDNLRAALAWCEEDVVGTEEVSGAEAGLRLAVALRLFWPTRSDSSEGRMYLHRARTQPGGSK